MFWLSYLGTRGRGGGRKPKARLAPCAKPPRISFDSGPGNGPIDHAAPNPLDGFNFTSTGPPNQGGVLCRPFSAPAQQQDRDEA